MLSRPGAALDQRAEAVDRYAADAGVDMPVDGERDRTSQQAAAAVTGTLRCSACSSQAR
jgi:hypothetical protein